MPLTKVAHLLGHNLDVVVLLALLLAVGCATPSASLAPVCEEHPVRYFCLDDACHTICREDAEGLRCIEQPPEKGMEI